MKIIGSLKQLADTTQKGGVVAMLKDLSEHLRGDAVPEPLRSAAHKLAAALAGSQEHEPAKTIVLNVAVAVAVGTPISKAGGDGAEGASPHEGTSGVEPEKKAVGGDGTPVVATATVSPLSDGGGASKPLVRVSHDGAPAKDEEDDAELAADASKSEKRRGKRRG